MKNKTWLKWTEDQIELLKVHWKSSTMEELLKQFPNRKYNSLMLKAQQLGIKSEVQRKRKGSLDYLNTLNTNSCYWWGFIMADGHLSKKGELIISLDNKDKNHLEKLAKHLNRFVTERVYINSFNGKLSKSCNLRIQDKKFGEKWLSILKINSAKTYTPPDLSIFLSEENLINFFIGLIDGDGCIWESKNWLNMKIELHLNWLNTLRLLSSELKKFYDIDCKVFVNKRGTSNLVINTKKDLRILKSYIKNTEFLERKWSKLDTL